MFNQSLHQPHYICPFVFYAFLFTSMYAIIETVYRQINYGRYTTIGQTVITFIWSPCIILHYWIFDDDFLSVLLFPFNIWLCEYIFGYLFLYYANMRFWKYNDNLTFCDGVISFYFGGYWFLLGIVLHDFFLIFPYSQVLLIISLFTGAVSH